MAIYEMSDATSRAVTSMNEPSGDHEKQEAYTYMNLRAAAHRPPHMSVLAHFIPRNLFDISFSTKRYSSSSGGRVDE